MKPTDFSKYLTEFLTKYLPHERGYRPNTIMAYRDTFVLFITYVSQYRNIKAEKLFLAMITREVVVDFLDWLQTARKSSDATRNNRLAALHSFFSYVQYLHPDHLYECQNIMSIRTKRAKKIPIGYLSIDGIRLVLAQPDIGTRRGRRDLAMLALMYDTGARVQEIIDLTPSSIRFEKPTTIRIIGKGNKTRIIPMLDEQREIIRGYLIESSLLDPCANLCPLFSNSRKEKLSRAGLNHILLKYVTMARQIDPSIIPQKISCHSLRHSKAMHLLQAGVNLVYIRDILGHASVQTTEIYARADSKQKRQAIEKAYVNVTPKQQPVWEGNDSLLNWLKTF